MFSISPNCCICSAIASGNHTIETLPVREGGLVAERLGTWTNKPEVWGLNPVRAVKYLSLPPIHQDMSVNNQENVSASMTMPEKHSHLLTLTCDMIGQMRAFTSRRHVPRYGFGGGRNQIQHVEVCQRR